MPEGAGKDSSGLVTYTVSVNGQKVDEQNVVRSIKVQKSVNKISYAKIVIEDGSVAEQDFAASNTDTFKPGSAVTISVGYESTESQIFEGIVVKHGIRIQTSGVSSLVLECKDTAQKLTVGRKNANYEKKKDSDAISSIVGNAGLTADVKATTYQHPEMVQYYATDWDFILSRAEANGCVVVTDDKKVSVGPPVLSGQAELKVTYGEDMLSVDLKMDAADQLDAVEATVWDIASQKVLQVSAAKPSVPDQGNIDSSALAGTGGCASFGIQSGVAMEQADAKAWVDAQKLKSWLARIQGDVSFPGNAKAVPNSLIELDGIGERFNGTAYVSGITHEVENGLWTTKATLGMSASWFSERENVSAPMAGGLLPAVNGLQVAVVKKIDADPAGEMRIQVTVPVLNAETQGIWARLASFYGTKDLGAFFIPEVGTEVVLGYINSDPRYPVILGSLYSSKNTAPYTIDADNTKKAIQTKEKLKLEFDEKDKVILVETPGGNSITISDKDKSIVLADQNSNTVTLGSSGIELNSAKDITITAKGKISLSATGECAIESKADVTVKGLNVNHTANVGFVAKGSASAEISASGQTTVKGAMVMIN